MCVSSFHHDLKWFFIFYEIQNRIRAFKIFKAWLIPKQSKKKEPLNLCARQIEMNAIDMQSQHSQRVDATIEQLKRKTNESKRRNWQVIVYWFFVLIQYWCFEDNRSVVALLIFGEQHFYCQMNLTLFTQCAFEYFFAKYKLTACLIVECVHISIELPKDCAKSLINQLSIHDVAWMLSVFGFADNFSKKTHEI